jgi:hypothetical protein
VGPQDGACRHGKPQRQLRPRQRQTFGVSFDPFGQMLSQTMRVGSVLGLALTGKILDKSDGERAARTYPPALPRARREFWRHEVLCYRPSLPAPGLPHGRRPSNRAHRSATLQSPRAVTRRRQAPDCLSAATLKDAFRSARLDWSVPPPTRRRRRHDGHESRKRGPGGGLRQVAAGNIGPGAGFADPVLHTLTCWSRL